MTVYGVDFSSAPASGALYRASGVLEGNVLTIHEVVRWRSFAPLEAWLEADGAWIAGLDFPFGLPAAAVLDLGWPPAWSDYVRCVTGRNEFADVVRAKPIARYRRPTDVLGKAQSPLNVVNPPVGKMFAEGAPRLLAASSVDVIPCRRVAGATKHVVEAYPGTIARRILAAAKEPRHYAKVRQGRAAIVDALGQTLPEYGIRVQMEERLRWLAVETEGGDPLDAILCAVQAAWSWTQRDDGYGIPPGHENEGWIADPS